MSLVENPMSQHWTTPPESDPDTRWWWDALERGELLLPHCTSCDKVYFPPMPSCPHCGSRAVDSITWSGEGTVYSWVVIHIPADADFASDVPYMVVAVDVEHGARLFGRITNGPLDEGTAVRAITYRVGEVTLLGFERV